MDGGLMFVLVVLVLAFAFLIRAVKIVPQGHV